MGHIYCLFNTVNGKRYIGQTSRSVSRRLHEHIRYTDFIINKAIKKYGVENFSYQTWEVPNEQLNMTEMSIIKQFNTKIPNGYNMTDGGLGGGGWQHSEEAKNKMSDRCKGNKNHFYGKKHTEENKIKMSKSSCHRKLSEDNKIKMRIGKIIAGEIKPIILIHPDGAEEKFGCMKDACIKYNLERHSLRKVCIGEFKQYKGFKARYIEENK